MGCRARLTIIFMACLNICFYSHSATATDCSVSIQWPEKCANKVFCLEKPESYPTTDEFKKLQANSNFDFSNVKTPPQTSNRMGDNICRQSNQPGSVYMIKDNNNNVRYVVQDTIWFTFNESFRECKPQIQAPPNLTCYQNVIEYELPVTTCDGNGIELYKIPLPTNCVPRTVTDYDE